MSTTAKLIAAVEAAVEAAVARDFIAAKHFEIVDASEFAAAVVRTARNKWPGGGFTAADMRRSVAAALKARVFVPERIVEMY